ncbi:LEE-encoded effector EspG, partial [Escherichia coli 95.0183]
MMLYDTCCQIVH